MSAPAQTSLWFIAMVGIVAALEAVAFVRFLAGRQWLLAACFGPLAVLFAIQTVVLVRRRNSARG